MDRYMSKAREIQAPSSTSSIRGSSSEENSHHDASSFSGPSTLFAQSTSVVAEQWKRATEMLSSHPSLMTNRILCMALKHRPPLHIVKCMLKLNPEAANLQRGDQPTALQVAIQSMCSVLVVECLIRACPLALVETTVIDLGNGNYAHLDPLSYARRYRSNDKELLRVLCLPLSHWMEQEKMINEKSTSGWSSGDESSSFMGCTSSSGFSTSGMGDFSNREPDNSSLSPSSAGMTSSGSDCDITPPRRLNQPTITVSPDEEPVLVTTSEPPASPVRATVASLAGMSAAVTSLMDKSTGGSTSCGSIESPVGTLGAAPRPASVRWASPLQTFLSSAKCSGSLSTTATTASETSYNHSSLSIPRRILSSRSTLSSTTIDPQEVANVKLICMAVLRGHRRLSAQLKSIMEEMQNQQYHHEVNVPEEILQYLDAMQEDILRKVEENMDEQLRSQLIALDMKEQHIRANVHRMERKLVRKVSKKQNMLNDQVVDEKVDKVMQVSRKRMKGFQERLDRMERLLLLEERARNLKEREHLYHSASEHIPGLVHVESNMSGNSNHPVRDESTKPLLRSNLRRESARDLVEARNPSFPVVFASPLTEIAYDDNRDDVRSLLTEDSFVARQDPKKPLRTHPLLQLLCKV